MKIQKQNPIKWRKWSWIHLADANFAFLSCESYRWSWSAFILEIYCDQNYQNYCPQIFSWRIFCIISEMVYRFSLLMEKSSLLSIFFFISYHFKDTFWSKADVQYWKSSVFLAGEAFFKLLITLIFFRKRSTIFFVVKNIFQNYFFADALNNAPNAAFRGTRFFSIKFFIMRNGKNVVLRNQQLIVQKKISIVVVTFFYLLSLSSH